jgi:hypothetical protein
VVHGENSFFIKKTEIAKEILGRVGIPGKEESLRTIKQNTGSSNKGRMAI